MILVTVGMQLGFDRLIEAMDALAPSLNHEVIAQIGKGSYQPRNMDARSEIAPDEFEELVKRCDVIVSHAGIGTVLTAQRFSKPIVLFPRRHSHGEHRNDHQVATVRHLEGRSGIVVAMDETELAAAIEMARQIGAAHAVRSPTASQLHEAVARFIETGAI
ncbi:glycosyltransferase [Qipengyuania nanhaisediminis]|uniref:glycosyltransferase n=1 Tax=Qipengyuania nanhaisediminis TaxID=604088 RepID=UPI0038B2B1A5